MRDPETLGIVFLLATSLAGAPSSAQTPTPGANVNMVSGTKWPGGDPFLQRQNEPSIAISTRNPLHVLGGANDYRTVDLASGRASERDAHRRRVGRLADGGGDVTEGRLKRLSLTDEGSRNG
jgi:hypothetical protein